MRSFAPVSAALTGASSGPFSTAVAAVALFVLGGSASAPEQAAAPSAPPPKVSLVDSLSFTNAMSGQPDALNVARPLAANEAQTDYFPMAQLKQCETDVPQCRWGVVNAQRKVNQARIADGSVALQLEVTVDVDRRQKVDRPDYAMAMAIPSDIPVLQANRIVKQDVVLEYGKVMRIEFPFGMVYQVCAMRMDPAGLAIDQCDIGGS